MSLLHSVLTISFLQRAARVSFQISARTFHRGTAASSDHVVRISKANGSIRDTVQALAGIARLKLEDRTS